MIAPFIKSEEIAKRPTRHRSEENSETVLFIKKLTISKFTVKHGPSQSTTFGKNMKSDIDSFPERC